jgi:3-hydroxyacyl-CoA dehydrogenase
MKRHVSKVGVLGSGVMGMGITAHLAGAGLEVVMLDIVPPDLSEEDKKKGITVDAPDFRNRFAAGALAKALKENPQSGPFLHRDDAELITVGNFEDHADLLKGCDWIIEVVVENLKIKQNVMKMVEKNWNKEAILSTNTSGIPLKEISEKMKPEMKKVFLGTHFFNPVRFMHLLEVIPFKETDRKVVEFIADFCEKRLGKGVVYGKDTPNFVANRIGVAGMIGTINLMLELGMKIDETDQIFGTPLGRPKSALFRTADMVGLDTLVHIAHNTTQYVKPEEARKYFTLPKWIEGMVEKKYLGNKTGSGFYRKLDKRTFKIIDPETLDYVDQSGEKFESLALSGFITDVGERIKSVVNGEGRESQFAKRAIYDQLVYAAERVGEICDSVVEIDNGMKWGFNFDVGPFEAWDALGLKESVAHMEAHGCKVPKKIKDMMGAKVKSFYKEKAGRKYYYDFKKKDYLPIEESDEVVNLVDLKKDARKVIDSRKTASIIDIGDGVYCVEFHSIMNSLDQDMWEMMRKAVDLAAEKGVGVVIGNQAPGMPGAFSAGANIGLILEGARSKQWDVIKGGLKYFQETNTYMTYSPVPVVAAPYGMTLGGGAEVAMSCNKMVCHHDLFMGLVEVGVGVIPGGGGCMLLLRHYQNFVPKNAAMNNLQPFVAPVLQMIGTATVSNSAAHARDLGFVRPGDKIAFNKRHLIGLAKKEVLAMAELGFVPPRPQKYQVMGDQLRGVANAFVQDMVLGGYATEYDAFILRKLAHILGGGYVSENSWVPEDYLLELEREVFVELCAQEKTQARLEHMLKTGKPLRN